MFRFCEIAISGLIDILGQAQVAILWDFLDTLAQSLPILRPWTDTVIEMNKI